MQTVEKNSQDTIFMLVMAGWILALIVALIWGGRKMKKANNQ
jgi:flagellar biogenesis protein FliO